VEIIENAAFEDDRPELDLLKEFVDEEELNKEHAELDDILNDDLDEWRKRQVKHGELTKMEYDHSVPDDVKRYGNKCSESERTLLLNATHKTLKVVQKSMANYDATKWKKWFGNDNDKQSDWMVKARIRNAYNKMKGGY